MGIREKLNNNPGLTTGITAAIILIAIIVIVIQLLPGSGPKIPTKAWYSSDDGKTYVADDINLLAPFEKDGKTWVRAIVFKCKDGKPFVSHLERYTPKAKAMIQKSREDMKAGNPPTMDVDQIQWTGMQVKKPGTPESEWTNQSDNEKVMKITEVVCPDGSKDDIEPVLP